MLFHLFLGVFELTGPSGLPAGQIEVSLTWKSAYVPSSSIVAAEMPDFIQEELGEQPVEQQHSDEDQLLTDKDVEEEQEAVDGVLHTSLSSKVSTFQQLQHFSKKL